MIILDAQLKPYLVLANALDIHRIFHISIYNVEIYHYISATLKA